MEQILLEGRWQASQHTGGFSAINPANRETLPGEFPVSSWEDCNRMLDAAAEAAILLRAATGEQIGSFLASYAEALEMRADELVDLANRRRRCL